MAFHYLLFIQFRKTETNLHYSNVKNSNRFELLGNEFNVITHFKSSNEISASDYPEIEESAIRGYSKIGFLIDIITICAENIISNKYDGFAFAVNENIVNEFYNQRINFQDFLKIIKGIKPLFSFGFGDEWPIVIEKGEKISYSEKKTQNIKYFFDCFANISKLDKNIMSLLNYWKMGYTLQKLWFWHESYLNYYKILEYFLKNYRNSFNNCISKNFLNFFQRRNIKKLNISKLLMDYSLDPTVVNEKLILDFIEIRNNEDIAHSKIKKQMMKKNSNSIIRAELFNFSYYDEIWEYLEDIRELSRYLIFKYLNFKNIELKTEGGSLEIELNLNS